MFKFSTSNKENIPAPVPKWIHALSSENWNSPLPLLPDSLADKWIKEARKNARQEIPNSFGSELNEILLTASNNSLAKQVISAKAADIVNLIAKYADKNLSPEAQKYEYSHLLTLIKRLFYNVNLAELFINNIVTVDVITQLKSTFDKPLTEDCLLLFARFKSLITLYITLDKNPVDLVNGIVALRGALKMDATERQIPVATQIESIFSTIEKSKVLQAQPSLLGKLTNFITTIPENLRPQVLIKDIIIFLDNLLEKSSISKVETVVNTFGLFANNNPQYIEYFSLVINTQKASLIDKLASESTDKSYNTLENHFTSRFGQVATPISTQSNTPENRCAKFFREFFAPVVNNQPSANRN